MILLSIDHLSWYISASLPLPDQALSALADEVESLRYISLFSGIEAASCAWRPLGWEAVAFAEVDEAASRVLAYRWPGVPNLGDITKTTDDQIRALGRLDVLIGGSPCQAFSIAGARGGLSDDRGNLAFEKAERSRSLRPPSHLAKKPISA